MHDPISASPGGPAPESLCCNRGELGRKLADAELEILHLNDFLKQNTQKYTEDIKKLEEKVRWQRGSSSIRSSQSFSGLKFSSLSFDLAA